MSPECEPPARWILCSLWVWKFWVCYNQGDQPSQFVRHCPKFKTESPLTQILLSLGPHSTSSHSDISTKKKKEKEREREKERKGRGKGRGRKKEGRYAQNSLCLSVCFVCDFTRPVSKQIYDSSFTWYVIAILQLSTHLGKTNLAQISRLYINHLSLFPVLQPDALRKHAGFGFCFFVFLSDSSEMKKNSEQNSFKRQSFIQQVSIQTLPANSSPHCSQSTTFIFFLSSRHILHLKTYPF